MRRALRYTLMLVTFALAHAQSAPDSTLGSALHSLASRAGIVFVGQVVKIEPRFGVVEVTFRVDRLVQGKAGGSYTLREWGGLWANGQPRYTLGQRAMVFLHAPGASGLSTPVDGMEGVVPVKPAAADTTPMLDARWLATRVERSVDAPLTSGAISLDEAVAAVHSASELRLFSMPLQPRPAPVSPEPILQRGVPDLPAISDAQRRPQILLQAVPDVR